MTKQHQRGLLHAKTRRHNEGQVTYPLGQPLEHDR